MLAGLMGCDLTVTNPGPVADSFLDVEPAHAALVGGMFRSMVEAQNWLAWTSSVIARELVASGGIGEHGFTVRIEAGNLDPSQVGTEWSNAHRARWLAEDGARRMRQAVGDERFAAYGLGAQALVYAGYANHFLGTLMCEAVIDGGAAEPSSVHLQHAEQQFTEAIDIAGRANNAAFQNAARAGRALARAALGKWADAVTDAQTLPRDFVFQLTRSTESDAVKNRFARGNQNQPWRSHSAWSTYFERYYTDTRDPRSPWSTNPSFPRGDGRPVLWYFETKYGGPNITAPIKLASGHHMQLIIAEARLRAGDRQAAMDIINQRRTALSLAPWTATTIAEAWTALKLERFIELWLEGRALADHRRYAAEQTPGPLPAEWNVSGRSLCFPISEAEREINPNIS
ncbi:MAG: RagB/SusD family nutrient uptake outer membrane protein [Longimicrobiales bacterium]